MYFIDTLLKKAWITKITYLCAVVHLYHSFFPCTIMLKNERESNDWQYDMQLLSSLALTFNTNSQKPLIIILKCLHILDNLKKNEIHQYCIVFDFNCSCNRKINKWYYSYSWSIVWHQHTCIICQSKPFTHVAYEYVQRLWPNITKSWRTIFADPP